MRKKFRNQITKSKGQKILYVQGNHIELGTISGSSKIMGFYNHRYVPIKNSMLFNTHSKKWEKQNKKNLYINEDIFEYSHPFVQDFIEPSLSGRGYKWSTDYSQTRFLGKKLSDIEIIIGDSLVKEEIKNLTIKIPAKRQKVPSPIF